MSNFYRWLQKVSENGGFDGKDIHDSKRKISLLTESQWRVYVLDLDDEGIYGTSKRHEFMRVWDILNIYREKLERGRSIYLFGP